MLPNTVVASTSHMQERIQNEDFTVTPWPETSDVIKMTPDVHPVYSVLDSIDLFCFTLEIKVKLLKIYQCIFCKDYNFT
jgi:hypothetical protein